MDNYYIIDFDSTFTQVEALDELARISLENHPAKNLVYEEIERLTNLAMDGKISFRESLSARVKLLSANRDHLAKLVWVLKKKVSTSFSRNREFFIKNADSVLIVSGGFKEFITPVVIPYHIKRENIYANTFLFDEHGNITGYDDTNPLSEEGGKVKLLRQLQLPGRIYGIGDGYSDFQLKESGLIERFFAFTENIERKSVLEKADHVTPSFDEFLYVNNLPRAISYPKNRILCLVVGDVPDVAVALLAREGFSVRVKDTFEDKYTRDVGMMLLGNGVILDDKKGKKRNAEFIPRRMAAFINKGDTDMSRNFPNLMLPKLHNAHRLIHIHRNVPGIMAKINNVFAENEINIVSQFLMTRHDIGYAVTDVETTYGHQLIKQLRQIENTIKFRLLY